MRALPHSDAHDLPRELVRTVRDHAAKAARRMTAIDFAVFVDKLATVSGEAILPFFRTSLGVEDKGSAAGFDPVTAADRAAEIAMRTLIKESFPEHGIVGEEYGNERTDAE